MSQPRLSGGWKTSKAQTLTEAERRAQDLRTDLTARGAQFSGPVEDRGFGRTVMLRIPGAGEMMLYQPRHPLAHNLP